MRFFNVLFLLIAAPLFHGAAADQNDELPLLNMDVVMRGGDPAIVGLNEGQFPKYRQGRCTIRFPRNGNFATKNGFFVGGWDSNQNSQCSGYDDQVMTYKLQRDGNFVSRCGPLVDYSTHTGQGTTVGDYVMTIDDACILHLYKGIFDCDSVDLEEELWTNIKSKLSNGDRLGQGEIVRFVPPEDDDNFASYLSLVMQSNDGNLVLYNGHNDNQVLWAANTEWDEAPSFFNEYYARVTQNGRILLVGIDYQYGDETVYFNKKLTNFVDGQDCFMVEYDTTLDDLVAVPCDGSRRRGLLRRVDDGSV